MWHEFDAERVRADVRTMSDYGIRVVRTLLPWDAFMPTPLKVADGCLRNLEFMLATAGEQAMRVIPVLFAHALGDCVMLPVYAIDVTASRAGVRVLTDAVVQPGGPRDQYTDSRMLEAAITWLDTLMRAFAGHPALLCWDFGHDTASVMRPRRIDDMRQWVALLATRVHEHGERCMLTFGTRDITQARGVRLGVLAPLLDACGCLLTPSLVNAERSNDARWSVFLIQLMQRLLGRDLSCIANVSASVANDVESRAAGADGFDEDRRIRETIDGVIETGCSSALATSWICCGGRVRDVPPFDRNSQLALDGLMNATGEPTSFGAAWQKYTSHEREQLMHRPWPYELNIGEYYSNLPDSLRDLYAMWQDGLTDHPAMLS
jgi:hypothetical protein